MVVNSVPNCNTDCDFNIIQKPVNLIFNVQGQSLLLFTACKYLYIEFLLLNTYPLLF